MDRRYQNGLCFFSLFRKFHAQIHFAINYSFNVGSSFTVQHPSHSAARAMPFTCTPLHCAQLEQQRTDTFVFQLERRAYFRFCSLVISFPSILKAIRFLDC